MMLPSRLGCPLSLNSQYGKSRFESIVVPLMRRILSNLHESRTLVTQRDTLLAARAGLG